MRGIRYVLISFFTVILLSVFAFAADDDTQWLNLSFSLGSISQQTGQDIVNSNQSRTSFIAVDPVYSYNLDGLSGSVRVFYYNSQMELLRSGLSSGGTLSISDGVAYIRFAGNTSNFGTSPRLGTVQGGFSILTQVTQLVQAAVGWLLAFCAVVLEYKLLLLFVIVVFVGLGFGLIRRIIHV